LRITDILWKERFAAKLADKHGVTTAEAEDALRSKPLVRRIAKGRVRGEHVYSALAQIRSGRHLTVFFIWKKHGIIRLIRLKHTCSRPPFPGLRRPSRWLSARHAFWHRDLRLSRLKGGNAWGERGCGLRGPFGDER
jgi:uncharacterized DUF497 family protein